MFALLWFGMLSILHDLDQGIYIDFVLKFHIWTLHEVLMVIAFQCWRLRNTHSNHMCYLKEIFHLYRLKPYKLYPYLQKFWCIGLTMNFSSNMEVASFECILSKIIVSPVLSNAFHENIRNFRDIRRFAIEKKHKKFNHLNTEVVNF